MGPVQAASLDALRVVLAGMALASLLIVVWLPGERQLRAAMG